MIEYNAPHRIVMHSIAKEGLSISKYILYREYSGTKLIVEARIIPSNIYEEQYQNLKTYIENEVEIS